MIGSIKFLPFVLVVLYGLACPLHTEGASHRIGYRTRGGYPWVANGNAWNKSQIRWPSYYDYYGYPVTGSMYQYSLPMNTSFYYSYPSTYADWTYPSYPYVGKFYTNQTPYYPKRKWVTYSRSRTRYQSSPSSTPYRSSTVEKKEGTRTGVFFGD